MRTRHRNVRRAVVAVVALLAAAPAAAWAQEWTAPRTGFGQPDLQGVWDFATITPLERPEEFAGRTVMTAEESAQYESARFELVDHDTEEGATFVCEGTGNYNEFCTTAASATSWTTGRRR